MRTRSIPDSLSAWASPGAKASGRARCGPRSHKAEKRELLLVSDDASLGENLKCAAARTGRAVVRVGGVADALQQMRAGQPAAVLLDLDLDALAAWKIADSLLQEERCPPLILLTAHGDQFDVSTAIRAGSLVDKSAGPSHLLETVEQTLAAPCSAQAERNAIQRIVIQWLRPCSWSVPVTPAYRFWGINE
jgi:DNA-binding response OmpR family regulator